MTLPSTEEEEHSESGTSGEKTPPGTKSPLKQQEEQPKQNKGKQRAESVDLMAPVQEYGWDAFRSRCQSSLAGVDTEEEKLRQDYKRWDWVGRSTGVEEP